MSKLFSRRGFAVSSAAGVVGGARIAAAQEKPPAGEATSRPAPIEAEFTRDYPAPDFKPSWKRPQLNRLLVQDFVIYAHADLPMTKKLLEREPGLIAATMNWGASDWESGLNGAAHMGRRDIVGYLLENGARPDLFCAAMLGLLDVVRSLLTFEPKLIDAKGPHGFSLHFHAQVGGEESAAVLDYLQSIKKLELRPIPFLQKPSDPPKKPS
jgi:hypothetical protein